MLHNQVFQVIVSYWPTRCRLLLRKLFSQVFVVRLTSSIPRSVAHWATAPYSRPWSCSRFDLTLPNQGALGAVESRLNSTRMYRSQLEVEKSSVNFPHIEPLSFRFSLLGSIAGAGQMPKQFVVALFFSVRVPSLKHIHARDGILKESACMLSAWELVVFWDMPFS